MWRSVTRGGGRFELKLACLRHGAAAPWDTSPTRARCSRADIPMNCC